MSVSSEEERRSPLPTGQAGEGAAGDCLALSARGGGCKKETIEKKREVNDRNWDGEEHYSVEKRQRKLITEPRVSTSRHGSQSKVTHFHILSCIRKMLNADI